MFFFLLLVGFPCELQMSFAACSYNMERVAWGLLSRFLWRVGGANFPMEARHGRHLVERVDKKCYKAKRAYYIYLSLSASHWRLGIGASGTALLPTSSLELPLTVCCVRPRAKQRT